MCRKPYKSINYRVSYNLTSFSLWYKGPSLRLAWQPDAQDWPRLAIFRSNGPFQGPLLPRRGSVSAPSVRDLSHRGPIPWRPYQDPYPGPAGHISTNSLFHPLLTYPHTSRVFSKGIARDPSSFFANPGDRATMLRQHADVCTDTLWCTIDFLSVSYPGRAIRVRHDPLSPRPSPPEARPALYTVPGTLVRSQ